MAKQDRFTNYQWEQMISETKKISKTDVARKYGTSIQALSYQMSTSLDFMQKMMSISSIILFMMMLISI